MEKILGAAAFIVLLSLAATYGVTTSPSLTAMSAQHRHQAKSVSRGSDVVLNRGKNGHFFADVEVNGTSINMIADTGASVVVLSVEDAEAAGINVSALDFNDSVATANGDAAAAAVTLDEVTIGSISRSNVQAVVIRDLSGSLLGMSFFRTLSKVAMEPDEMVLED